MYQYIWDTETGGLLLTTEIAKFSKEPRPVYYQELDILGFDRYWNYPKDDSAPLLWAEANNYIYKGRNVARLNGGALYTAPEIVILEEAEPNGNILEFVNIQQMINKNAGIMQVLEDDTIQSVYNTYVKYKHVVDAFHVSYSGGKDSEVTLDIVQKALPHSEFVVIFGDTGMEFPDTYQAVENMKKYCESKGIAFYIAKSQENPIDMWKVFGPPSQTIRWCCSVHKTTPQLIQLRSIVGKNNLTEMAFVGVRGDESARRSEYDFISQGTKHKGQYSCNPILHWSSAEIYLYLFSNSLYLNETYKKGNSRAGCLVCPMSGDRHDYMRRASYPNEVDTYIGIIKDMNVKGLETQADEERFINSGGWKVRNNGRDIKGEIKYIEKNDNTIVVKSPAQKWNVWLHTIGSYDYDGDICTLSYKGNLYTFQVEERGSVITVTFDSDTIKMNQPLVKMVKQVFRKAAYCIGCRECEADCPFGCLHFLDGKIKIAEDCRHCMNCHKPDGGCLLYKSREQPKGTGKMKKSIDSYADHAPKMEWILSFFLLKEKFFDEHDLGTMMISMFKRFLRDAELVDKDKPTELVYILENIGIQSSSFWAILLVNLSYSSEVGWYIKNVPFDEYIKRDYLVQKLKEDGLTDRGARSVSGAYKRILTLPFGELTGLGEVVLDGKVYDGIIRNRWSDPDAKVILYSLYKFAEACGDYYQFTLENLLDDSIERDGVSPTRIFGLDRDTMVRILNGLSVNYPEFISASFTLDLDTITLRPTGSELTSKDVLKLF